MRKLFVLVLALCLMVGISHATMVDMRSSGNTATFSTVVSIVTFNSVTNWLYFRNECPTSDCYVILGCQKGVAIGDAILKLPAYGTQTPNTVEFNYSTKALGFISNRQTPASSGTAKITYLATGDDGDL